MEVKQDERIPITRLVKDTRIKGLNELYLSSAYQRLITGVFLRVSLKDVVLKMVQMWAAMVTWSSKEVACAIPGAIILAELSIISLQR